MIKTKNLSYKNLKKLNIQERIEAAKTPGIGQTLMSALTPTQIAELFPRYYLMREPDISGFLKAMPTSMSAARQAQFQEQLQNTASGEASGKNMESGGWRRKLQQGVNESATVLRPGQSPAPKLTPEQLETAKLLSSGQNLAVDDPRTKFIGTLSPEQLKSVNLEKYKDESGKEFYKYAAPPITEEEIREKIISQTAKGKGEWAKDTEFMNEVERVSKKFQIKPNDLLSVMAFESGISASKTNPNGGATGLIQFMPKTATAMGTTTDELRSMSRSQQMKFVEKYLEMNHIKPGSNAADIYSKVFLPARSNKDVLTVAGENYYDQNRGLDRDGDGRITKSDLQAAAESAGRRKGVGMGDPVTVNYNEEQRAAIAKQIELERETKYIGNLAAASQAQMGLYTDTPVETFKGDIPDKFGANRQCASLSKHFAPQIGKASTWNVNYDSTGSNIRPGAIIATTTYGPNGDSTPFGHFPGGEMARRLGGTSYYHTGVALSKPDGDGNVLILEQFVGESGAPRVRKVNIHNYNGHGTKLGLVQGGEPTELSMQAVGIGKKLATGEQLKWINASESGKQKTDTSATGQPTPSEIPHDQPKSSVAAARRESSVIASATQAHPDKQLNEPVEVPHGKHRLGETKAPATAPAPSPAPVPEKKEEPKTIKQFVKGEGYATIKDVPNPKYVPPSEPPKTEPPKTEPPKTGVGINRVEESLKAPDKSSKPGDVNPQPQGQNKLAEPVKTNSKGGSNRTHTDQITALPIGGIKDDNSVVVDANKQPLFTMNTDKESAVYDPVERKVDVVPNKKTGEIGRMPERTQATVEMKSDIVDTKDGTHKPQDITKGSESHISDRDPHMIDQILDMTRNIFLDPSAARAFSRARFHETGDATNDFHHSTGNSNML